MSDAKQKIIDTLLPRIQGMQQARENKYIMLHAPKDKLDAITDLLPGAERPHHHAAGGRTNQVALHVVSSETLFWGNHGTAQGPRRQLHSGAAHRKMME